MVIDILKECKKVLRNRMNGEDVQELLIQLNSRESIELAKEYVNSQYEPVTSLKDDTMKTMNTLQQEFRDNVEKLMKDYIKKNELLLEEIDVSIISDVYGNLLNEPTVTTYNFVPLDRAYFIR